MTSEQRGRGWGTTYGVYFVHKEDIGESSLGESWERVKYLKFLRTLCMEALFPKTGDKKYQASFKPIKN